jgi:hypothetical protein
MRAHAALALMKGLVEERLDEDVADVLIEGEMFEAAARTLAQDLDEQGLTEVVTEVIEGIDDGTADWLVSQAESPSAWFFSRMREQVA